MTFSERRFWVWNVDVRRSYSIFPQQDEKFPSARIIQTVASLRRRFTCLITCRHISQSVFGLHQFSVARLPWSFWTSWRQTWNCLFCTMRGCKRPSFDRTAWGQQMLPRWLPTTAKEIYEPFTCISSTIKSKIRICRFLFRTISPFFLNMSNRLWLAITLYNVDRQLYQLIATEMNTAILGNQWEQPYIHTMPFQSPIESHKRAFVCALLCVHTTRLVSMSWKSLANLSESIPKHFSGR